MVICTEKKVVSITFSNKRIENEFLMIFTSISRFTAKPIPILSTEHFFSEDIANKLKNFELSYKSTYPKMGELFSIFSKLEIDEYFLLYPVEVEMTDEISELTRLYIKYINLGYDESKANQEVMNLYNDYEKMFSGIKEKYEMVVFNPPEMIKVGEKIKAKRVCRFCNKMQGEFQDNGKVVTFKSIAHAIPEALGNKFIIGNEECDCCNSIFVSSIELDLINFCNIYRVFWGVEGKKNVPTITYKNGSITNREDTFIVRQAVDNFIDTENNDKYQIKLDSREKINFMGIYRCLIKMALSVIDRKYIMHFSRTIQWINGEYFGPLPSVAICVHPHAKPHRHPSLILYLRKDDNKDIPYMVSEFSFCGISFVYIIPFCDQDTKSFIEKADFDKLWSIFKHYNQKEFLWNFMDFSDNRKVDCRFNIKISNNQAIKNGNI